MKQLKKIVIWLSYQKKNLNLLAYLREYFQRRHWGKLKHHLILQTLLILIRWYLKLFNNRLRISKRKIKSLRKIKKQKWTRTKTMKVVVCALTVILRTARSKKMMKLRSNLFQRNLIWNRWMNSLYSKTQHLKGLWKLIKHWE